MASHRSFIQREYIHPASYWETDGGKEDLEGLTRGRMNDDRRTYIPWINSFLPLRGSRILEVGAGTGSSTVALAEQGASVVGIDILEPAIKVAKDKCRIFGVSAELLAVNAINYMAESRDNFDAVIFFASLEHMLPDERLKALTDAWKLIRPGGYLIVIEAPNRLWYFDGHTSRMPFFNWLPEKLALQHIQFSPRPELVELLTPPSEANMLELQRWGLGVSFHEFDVSLGRDVRMMARQSLGEFLRRRNPIRYLEWRISGNAKYARFLERAAPGMWAGWFEPDLDLAIRRP